MADAAEHTTYTDAATAISQGKRHLLVQDYTAAVAALAEGLEMMSQKLGDGDDALGEPYLLYGRALLGLAREEVGVLGEGVPGSEEAEEDDEDEDDEENEEDDKASEPEAKEAEQQETHEENVVVDEEKKVSADKEESCKDNVAKEKKNEETAAASNKTDDKKIEEAKMDDASSKGTENKVIPGTSKDSSKNAPEAGKSSNCNGTAGTSTTADDEDDVNKDEEEEDPSRGNDLQVAWEVLELAKIVFAKRGDAGLKHLAETHRLLGEVAMESDNHQGAIADLESALGLLEKIEPREPRALADIHYQLGLAHSMANDFDASIKQFAEATSLLETRIKQLKETPEGAIKSDDPFYSVEGEIKELRELLPAIQEKIIDMKDFKEEARNLLIESYKNKVASGNCTNGSSVSNDGASGSNEKAPASSNANPKPASDISHLVRKKRKHESDTEEQVQSPCKKATP